MSPEVGPGSPSAGVRTDGLAGTVSRQRSASVLRLGVLGCAEIAIRRIFPALAGQKSLRLVAVASRNRDKAVRVGSHFGCAAVVGYGDLISRDDVDAVYIPLPPGMHYEWVAEALRAGKHVLVEKPLCTTYSQALELVTLARRLGLVLTENFMFLHHSQHDAVRAMLSEGTIGETRVFASSFGVPPLDPSSFRYQNSLGGGALFDVGVYPIRAAQLHLPGELEVLAACLRIDDVTGVDVSGSALLCNPEGLTAHLDFGFQHVYRSTYSLWGSRGRISVMRAFTPPEHHKPLVRIEKQDLVTELSMPADHQVRNALNAFAVAALTGGANHSLNGSLLNQAKLVEQVRKVAKVVGVAANVDIGDLVS